MTAIEDVAPAGKSLKDRAVNQKLQELRVTDNVTNWFYIARAWLIIALAIGGAIAFHQWTRAEGWSAAWNLPVFLLAIVVVGASQHQLAATTHEATHHILFKNRWLNELASDWLSMFPLFSSTYIYRIPHLAHHQFINDEERDPDLTQLSLSGHWMRFPVSKSQFVRKVLQQALLIGLVRYIMVRAKYNGLGTQNNPYAYSDRQFSALPNAIAVAYLFGSGTVARFLITGGDALLIGLVPLAVCAVAVAALLAVPAERYLVFRLHPLISPKVLMLQRVAFVTLLFYALTWAEYLTGAPAWAYFLILWVASIFTAFSFFMILRQVVQHGNGDRGWLTNSRTFLVNPFIRYAVFPLGMDYHLPHHMFCTVPHYRLAALHAFLLEYPEYTQEGLVVEGYFFPQRDDPDRPPTVVEVLGPEYNRNGSDIFIDDSVWETPGRPVAAI